jgi:hypothetical protein
MKRRFEEFRESRLNRTVACSSAETIHEIAGQYDALVAGSDQIWHFSRPAMYFLDWGLPYRGKRIGYAACCGSVNQPTGRRSEVSKWLANFQSIGVRDDFSKEIIDELTLGDVPVVADPTVLTSLSDIHTPVPNMPDRYILTYTLGQEITGGNRMLLDALRTEVGKMPVVGVIPSAHKPHMAPWADTCIWDCGPTQWLHLIANASFLLTDSFHGALFALRSGTPFLAYYRESARAPRLLDLARRYSLSAHIASDVEEAMGNRCWETSDYGQSLGLMASHAAYSTEYLRCALAG